LIDSEDEVQEKVKNRINKASPIEVNPPKVPKEPEEDIIFLSDDDEKGNDKKENKLPIAPAPTISIENNVKFRLSNFNITNIENLQITVINNLNSKN
jgi:hypothetical protein